MNHGVFVGGRLRIARTFRGLSLAALGEGIGSSRQYVQQFEADSRHPNDRTLAAIAAELGFEETFFTLPLVFEIDEAACSFRSRRSTLKSVKSRVIAYGLILSDVISQLSKYLRLPPIAYPRIKATEDREIAISARECRLEMGLGASSPVKSMTRALENSGVVVTRFEGVSSKVDALSISQPYPLVARSSEKHSSSRTRFDLAHELGHLVMHEPGEAGTLISEAQADTFASAFLFPDGSFLDEYSTFTWPDLFKMKQRWGMSVAALVRKAFDLNCIGAAEYRRANVHIRKRRWHLGEPYEGEEEVPELIAAAFEELEHELALGPSEISNQLGISDEIFELVTGIPFDHELDATADNVSEISAHRQS